ncbi:ParB/RepB/Spo0J family partition protein [Sedimentitalea sp. JM2-8]|uniref:ParB/RepB/Spo0J family partition protein n=1 Tax=Sedimentitalea xiamensis TaxID=3050037 RepID=A0ABT7FLB2_9RHOB|nr:ParB/RepB/Spo0J family partition protein [Sedimentitalea xiamensis]MDK3075509.1 ParB/RepB/Spo0J family partition protein [Sedimentitalea xiamensis]
MTIEMIALNKLQPTEGNPRKHFDQEKIEGLAQSILTDGLLQNFVAAKPDGRKRKYAIISGERRFRAMNLLIEQGHLPKDVTVPVEVREGLKEDDTKRIATVENVQRENLSPLEAANAIAALAEGGGKLEDIVSKTGLSVSTLRRRMALLNLSPTVTKAFTNGEITVSQAEALSVGNHDAQDDLLKDVIKGWCESADDIRDRLLGELPSLSMAIFDVNEYDGSFTKDLFGADDTTFFNDADQFYALQKKAATDLVREHDKTADWAELLEGRFEHWQFRKAEEGQSAGVIVCLFPEGKVEIHEGLLRRTIDTEVADTLKGKTKPTYASTVCEYIAMQKSAAVQAELVGNPRKAREIGVAQMLYEAAAHPCLRYLTDLGEDASHLVAINAEAGALCGLLGIEKQGATYYNLLSSARSVERAYDLVQPLSDDELMRLFAFLSAVTFGQRDVKSLDKYEHSIFNRVACDLSVDMREHWTPDLWFLSRRTAKQLGSVLREAAMTRLFGNGGGYKKSELVTAMVRYFKKVRGLAELADDQQKARDWLPEAMHFPAIDPDAPRGDKIEDEEDEADLLAEAA